MLDDLVAYFLWRMADGKPLTVSTADYEAFVDETGGGVTFHAAGGPNGGALVLRPLKAYTEAELALLHATPAGEA